MSMRRGAEYVDFAGLRLDGRREREVRVFNSSLNVLSHADGSAYIEQGNTKVLAAVYGPSEPKNRGRVQHDKLLVTCEFSVAPFSSTERRKRGKGDKRSLEISFTIKKAMESLILTTLHPRSEVFISLHVLQSDGGIRAACMNAATMAIASAGIPMKDLLCGCSAACVDGSYLTDVNALEESTNSPEVLVGYLPNHDKIAVLQMESKIAMDGYDTLTESAVDGALQVRTETQIVRMFHI